MTDGRPVSLSRHLEDASTKNDKLIMEALAELENPEKRGKRKATVAVICHLTGLSRNTIRSRTWALGRLKTIKQKLKVDPELQSSDQSAATPSEPTPRMLRDRIKCILEQNALLYEEILSLRGVIANKDREIQSIKSGKLVSIAPPDGRVTE